MLNLKKTEPVVSVGCGSKRVKHWSVTGVILLYTELWRLTIEIIPEKNIIIFKLGPLSQSLPKYAMLARLLKTVQHQNS